MRKIFKYAIEIEGIDQVLIQEVKKPVVELGSVEHGGANGTNEKTAGGTTVSDAELIKLKPSDASDKWAWEWMQEAINGNPSDYKRDVIFKELADDGVTTLDRWLWEGVWVKKSEDGSYKRGNQSENVLETVILSVDGVRPL